MHSNRSSPVWEAHNMQLLFKCFCFSRCLMSIIFKKRVGCNEIRTEEKSKNQIFWILGKIRAIFAVLVQFHRVPQPFIASVLWSLWALGFLAGGLGWWGGWCVWAHHPPTQSGLRRAALFFLLYHRGRIHGPQTSLLGMATSAKGQFGIKVRKLGAVKLDMFMRIILVDIAFFSQSTSAI